ncbi:hypothetical protein BX616_008134 [Lobosporangium transversale]|nr:hypothetical protein BX616_008134 [Lobosporangium transversale]
MPSSVPSSPSSCSPASTHRTSAHSGHALATRPRKYIGHYDIADRTFQLLSRHRAAACILFWSLTILLDILLQLPIEWFFLFYFILALVFRIFFIGGHIVLISIGAMCISNAIVFYTVPFSFTSPFATGVAFGLMVSLIHGLNLKGVILAMTMYMLKPYIERQTLIASLNPPAVPSIVFLAPLASFCSAFGVLWLLYDLFGYLHASTDDLRDFFGITLPAPSIVTLKDVKDRSITLNWQCSSQATISKHLIEIDGLIIGESGKQETSVVIQGLYPDNTYRIRLWAITARNWKTPSDYVVVRTLASVPVELELSTAENARRESEMIKQLIKETEHMQLNKEREQEVIDTTTVQRQDSSAEGNKNTSSSGKDGDGSKTSATQPSTLVEDGPAGSPATGVTDEQIAALRIQLQGKEAAHALLIQQLTDLEKQYKQQEEKLKNEISALREQQKLEDEPRQLAKAKLKELQESLREAEAHKSKIEKEHRMEVEKRQRAAEQLEAKHRKLESLQRTLRQSEERFQSEKKSHRQQMHDLEAALKKRSEDVKAAESSLKAMQESQKELYNTIEVKELELQKLQATIHLPKGHLSWEQKSKDLDVRCTRLTQQLAQYKAENQQLQEQLAEASKNISHVKSAREARRAQVEARKAATAEAQSTQNYLEQQSQDTRSTWVRASWNNNPGIQILNGLFQDDTFLGDARSTPVRKITGPPPGLPAKASNSSESIKAMESSAPGYGRSRKNSITQNSSTSPGSPSRSNAHVGQPFESQRYSMSPRARFQAVGQVHSPPIAHGQPHWGGPPSSGVKPGSISAGAGNKLSLAELESKGSSNIASNQSYNYHRLFGTPTSMDMSSGMLSEAGMANEHQLNEQTVIKTMFEAPDTLDLRHPLRTVGNHSSLVAQSKILPSHLRSASTPGIPSPLSSPIATTLQPYQSSSPSWDLKPIGRHGTLDRMHSQAEGSSSSLNYSDSSSPTSPHLSSLNQVGQGFTRKSLIRKSSADRGFWPGYDSADGGWARGPEGSYSPMLHGTHDLWGQNDGRFKSAARHSGISSVRDVQNIGIESLLPSPNGSSVSSLDTGTPLSMDAIAFADHYFSSRSHRGFEAPSSLSSAAFSSATIKQPMMTDNSINLSGAGAGGGGGGSSASSRLVSGGGIGPINTLSALDPTTNVSGNDETDIFGYGLKLNPFGWTIPTENYNDQDIQAKE